MGLIFPIRAEFTIPNMSTKAVWAGGYYTDNYNVVVLFKDRPTPNNSENDWTLFEDNMSDIVGTMLSTDFIKHFPELKYKLPITLFEFQYPKELIYLELTAPWSETGHLDIPSVWIDRFTK
jgi:hypothetical protein